MSSRRQEASNVASDGYSESADIMKQHIINRPAVVTLVQRQVALGIQLTTLTKVMRGLAAAMQMQSQGQKGKVQSQRICRTYPVVS